MKAGRLGPFFNCRALAITGHGSQARFPRWTFKNFLHVPAPTFAAKMNHLIYARVNFSLNSGLVLVG